MGCTFLEILVIATKNKLHKFRKLVHNKEHSLAHCKNIPYDFILGRITNHELNQNLQKLLQGMLTKKIADRNTADQVLNAIQQLDKGMMSDFYCIILITFFY